MMSVCREQANVDHPQAQAGAGLPRVLIEAMRPQHWVKNSFVLAPMLFSGRFTQLGAWAQCLPAVAAFCLLASGIYLINDICDRAEDRAHPIKRNRPVASGRLSTTAAGIAAVVLASAGLGLIAVVEILFYDPRQPLGGLGLMVWTGLYVVLNLLYSFWLKRHIIVDVLAVAMGFVLRAMAGAAAINVPISPWLVVCTLTLCLFIALAKRRSEITDMPPGQADAARRVNRGYPRDFLEHMLTVSAAAAILTYSIYCLAPRTVENVGSAHMVWTIPLVVYGMFRYYRLSELRTGGDPVSVLVRDRILWFVLAAYVLMSAVIITYGKVQSVRKILNA